MKSILEELFYGNVCPNSDCRSQGEQTKELMGCIADHHDNLLSILLTNRMKSLKNLIFAGTSLRILTKERFLCMLLSLA